MKKINAFLVLVTLSFLFGSCLKDPKITEDLLYGDEGIGQSAIIDIPLGTEASLFIDNAEGSQEIELTEFRYGNNDPAPEDITIELEFDQSLIDEYNEENETGYVLPSSDKFTSVTGMSVVIPRGERSTFFKINVQPSDFLGGEYVFPLKIKSVSPSYTVNALRDHVFMIFGTKNPYDGVYRYRSSANQTLGPNSNRLVELLTVDANTVQMKPGLIGVYSNLVRYTVDPATNIVTTYMESLLPITNFSESKYDPATKTFNLKWTSNGGGRLFEETLTYVRSR